MITQDIVDECAENWLDRAQEAGLPEEEIDLYLLEWKGGKCPDCGTPYEPVTSAIYTPETRIQFGKFSYFQPTCRCLADKNKRAENAQRVSSLLRAAKIPKRLYHCSIENWDFGVRDETNEAFQMVAKFCRDKRYRERGLVLYGHDVGVGKTHCAVAVLREMAGDGMTVRYVSMASLVQQIIRGGDEFLRDLREYDGVLLDDMDKIGTTGSDWVRERIFAVVDGRFGDGKVVLATTNFEGPEEFNEKFGEAVMSRIIGRCDLYAFRGDDYRMKQRESDG